MKHKRHTRKEITKMTPQELSDAMQAAVKDQFGDDIPAEVFPSKFFRYDVFTFKGDPNGPTRTQRAPKYCATDEGATDIMSVMGGDRIVMGNAMDFAGLEDGWKDTSDVPWGIFKDSNGNDGKPINLGLLLDYFNHGISGELAFQNAVLEIAGSFQQ